MTRKDRDHLRTLAICHYVLSGICFFFGFIGIFYLFLGVMIVNDGFGVPPPPRQAQQQPAPPFPADMLGWLFIGAAAFMILFYWGLAAGLLVAGRCLTQRKRHMLCLIVAGFSCLFQPLGMALGIFTFIVLLRPSVRAAFEPVAEESPDRPADDQSEHDRYHTE